MQVNKMQRSQVISLFIGLFNFWAAVVTSSYYHYHLPIVGAPAAPVYADPVPVSPVVLC